MTQRTSVPNAGISKARTRHTGQHLAQLVRSRSNWVSTTTPSPSVSTRQPPHCLGRGSACAHTWVLRFRFLHPYRILSIHIVYTHVWVSLSHYHTHPIRTWTSGPVSKTTPSGREGESRYVSTSSLSHTDTHTHTHTHTPYFKTNGVQRLDTLHPYTPMTITHTHTHRAKRRRICRNHHRSSTDPRELSSSRRVRQGCPSSGWATSRTVPHTPCRQSIQTVCVISPDTDSFSVFIPCPLPFCVTYRLACLEFTQDHQSTSSVRQW